jgi:2-dehydro-3-deoxyphosphogalactonate aldolase
MIKDVFERHVFNQDPFQIEAMWRRIYTRGYSARPDITLVGVLSGIEMACWDIMGKSLDKPVHALLGGKMNDRLRSYTYIYPEPSQDETVYTDPDLSAERAASYVAAGFTALKFDPAGPYTVHDPRQPLLEDIDRSEQFCKRLREAVGNRADLLFGTHGQFTPSGAIRLARQLEAYSPLWFEEPVPPDMPEEMAKVAQATRIPIATGERLATKWEFARVLRTGAANIIQMAIGRVGNILEAKKIASMAEAYYAQIAPHLYCGPVVGAANIQLSVSLPNFLILESIEQWGGFHNEILKKPIKWSEGYVLVPDDPGLGVELDETVALANPYQGDLLHLETRIAPVLA